MSVAITRQSLSGGMFRTSPTCVRLHQEATMACPSFKNLARQVDGGTVELIDTHEESTNSYLMDCCDKLGLSYYFIQEPQINEQLAV